MNSNFCSLLPETFPLKSIDPVSYTHNTYRQEATCDCCLHRSG